MYCFVKLTCSSASQPIVRSGAWRQVVSWIKRRRADVQETGPGGLGDESLLEAEVSHHSTQHCPMGAMALDPDAEKAEAASACDRANWRSVVNTTPLVPTTLPATHTTTMSSADDNAAHGRSQKARRPRPKFRTHNIVKLRPDNDFGFRGADPGTEPSTEFPCQSWKCPQGRGNLGSAELQVEMACHASSRAWAAAAVQGQDAVDQLCNATVTLAVADKAIELWECVGGRKADSRNYWVSARRQYDNCVPEDVQEWRAGLPALVQQAYNLVRISLPWLHCVAHPRHWRSGRLCQH